MNLLEHYEKNKEEWGFKTFRGFKYYQSNQIRTITNIHQERENNYYALYCDNSDLVSFSCHDANTFLNRLCNGIMDAVEIIAEEEKKTRLDLFDWQNEQDKIAIYKDIINSWKS